ncbi:unnamed protein product [Boreogadus saida]
MRSSTWLLPLLLLSSSTSGASGQCAEEIFVRRNQVFVAQEGEPLEVQCPVSFCSDPPPRVSWVKYTKGSDKDKPGSVLESRWEGRSDSSGVSYLTFTHLLLNHSGEYRCGTSFTKGHIINITVTGSAEVSVEEDDERRAERGGPARLPPYLWASAGVLLCVVAVVTLSLASLQRCPGDPRRTAQYQDIVSGDQDIVTGDQDIVSGDQDIVSGDQDSVSGDQDSVSGDQDSVSGQEEEEEEGEESMWYAALNHDVTPVAPRVRRSDSVQDVEYAAIHVA